MPVCVGVAFVAVVIEQQAWPHHGPAVGIGFALLTLVVICAVDRLLGIDRHGVAGDLLVGRVVLAGVAALVVGVLLLQVTNLAGYLVLAAVLGLSVLFLGGAVLLDWWASRRAPL